MTFLWRSSVLCVAALVAQDASPAERAQEPLTVFAAASLTDSLQQISDAYTASSGIRVRLAFAASSVLARQIEAGARADVFFSADQDWMDYLEEKQLIEASSRTDLVANRLALIAPRSSELSVKIAAPGSIAAALGKNARLATGDPDAVPVGKYAKAALTSIGQWNAIEPRLVPAENTRVALMYVARGEVPLGIVYSTDAVVEPRVRIIDLFPETSHQPITYPVALTRIAQPRATQYLAYLRSEHTNNLYRGRLHTPCRAEIIMHRPQLRSERLHARITLNESA